MMTPDRKWTHDESPELKPSAATYRLGCRCYECKAANSTYMAAYRAKQVEAAENLDGTAVYHSHLGQPSKRTARKWMCIHPRCLALAGLAMTPEGAVVDAVTGVADAMFGAVPGVAA